MAKRIPLGPISESLEAQPLSAIEEGDEGVEGLLDRPDADAEKLSEFMQLFGGKEYKVRVEEFNNEEKIWLHLDTFPVDGFEPFETCKRFGPGRYRLTFLNDKGRYVKGGQPQIRIGGKALAAIAASAPASQDANPLNNPIVMMMLAQANENAKANAELVRAILLRPEPAKSTTNEVMDLLIKLKAMDPKETKDDTMKKLSEALMMKMIEKGMDGGDGDGGGGLLSEIKDAMPIIKEVLAARLPQRAPAPRPTQISAPPSEVPAVNPLIEALRPYLAIFKAKAEKNADKERAANFLLDELDESVIPLIKLHVPLAAMASDAAVMESLISRAKDPAQVETLFSACPELVPHKEWIVSVIAQAVAIAETPNE